MLDRVSQLTAVSGLVLLALAGILLAVGHNPEAYSLNYQAETLANFAYGLFVASVLLSLLARRKRP